jgi:hypothetical protein
VPPVLSSTVVNEIRLRAHDTPTLAVLAQSKTSAALSTEAVLRRLVQRPCTAMKRSHSDDEERVDHSLTGSFDGYDLSKLGVYVPTVRTM